MYGMVGIVCVYGGIVYEELGLVYLFLILQLYILRQSAYIA
jgi:hypothetical protein